MVFIELTSILLLQYVKIDFIVILLLIWTLRNEYMNNQVDSILEEFDVCRYQILNLAPATYSWKSEHCSESTRPRITGTTIMESNCKTILSTLTLVQLFQIVFCESYIDLSYTIGNGTNLWPTHRKIQRIVESEQVNENGQWVSSNSYIMSEHTTPYHVYPTTWKLDEIPTERLYDVPAVMIDASRKAFLPGGTIRSNYAVSKEDVLEWEYYNGKVPNNSLVLVRTGWGRKWNNSNEFLGIKSDGILSFPGIGLSASKFLVNERQIYGLGIDTVSLDIGITTTFPTHAYCGSRNVYLIENAANLEQLPPRGFKAFVFPIRLDQSTGSPVRIFAVVP